MHSTAFPASHGDRPQHNVRVLYSPAEPWRVFVDRPQHNERVFYSQAERRQESEEIRICKKGKRLYDAIMNATCRCYGVDDTNDVWRPIMIHSNTRTSWERETLRVFSMTDGINWPADDRLGRGVDLIVREECDTILKQIFFHDTRVRVLKYDRAYVLGTPGIGKTFLSSYILWRLLTEDVCMSGKVSHTQSDLPIVYILYEVHNYAHVFDKVNKTGRSYQRSQREEAANYFRSLLEDQHGNRSNVRGGLLLFDCGTDQPAPVSTDYPTIAFTPPDPELYKAIKASSRSRECVMNAWTPKELCVWTHCVHGNTNGISWEGDVRKWMEIVGCIPRFLASKEVYENRAFEVRRSISEMTPENVFHYTDRFTYRYSHWHSHVLVQMRREEDCAQSCFYEAVSVKVGFAMAARVKSWGEEKHMKWCLHILNGRRLYAGMLPAVILNLCMVPRVLAIIVRNSYTSLLDRESSSVVRSLGGVATIIGVPTNRIYETPTNPLLPGVLYTPDDATLEVIDAFVLVKGTGDMNDTFIGIQFAISRSRAPRASALAKFKELIDTWGIRAASKVIICVGPEWSPAMHHYSVQEVDTLPERSRQNIIHFWDTFTLYRYVVQDEINDTVRSRYERESIKERSRVE